jgi:photosystem II stability/assembly factor-like uncharacterized protein
MRTALTLLAILAATSPARAQWTLETSNTTADLRGIHSIGNGVAWASGTHGTVLRTEDGGYLWQSCSVPPGAEKLDFRGIQAFDANKAIVMSSGKGDLSRLYKTTDGCHSWRLIFTNPDKDGFFDAITFTNDNEGALLGDPVDGKFALWQTSDAGVTWGHANHGRFGLIGRVMRPALKGEGAFAASNSAMIANDRFAAFVTGGVPGARIFSADVQQNATGSGMGASIYSLPLGKGTEGSGAFSICPNERGVTVIVGGNYQLPEESSGTAVFSETGRNWLAAQTPPHGYRSAVAYDSATKTWITVGPNGTDISIDDGKNWRPLHPVPASHEASDADRNWNALSLPFVVGPRGRIGKLDEAVPKR